MNIVKEIHAYIETVNKEISHHLILQGSKIKIEVGDIDDVYEKHMLLLEYAYIAQSIFDRNPYPLVILQADSTLFDCNQQYVDMIYNACIYLFSDEVTLKKLIDSENVLVKKIQSFGEIYSSTPIRSLVLGCNTEDIGQCIYPDAEWKKIQKSIGEAVEYGQYHEDLLCETRSGERFFWRNTSNIVRMGRPEKYGPISQENSIVFLNRCTTIHTQVLKKLQKKKISISPFPEFIYRTVDAILSNPYNYIIVFDIHTHCCVFANEAYMELYRTCYIDMISRDQKIVVPREDINNMSLEEIYDVFFRNIHRDIIAQVIYTQSQYKDIEDIVHRSDTTEGYFRPIVFETRIGKKYLWTKFFSTSYEVRIGI